MPTPTAVPLSDADRKRLKTARVSAPMTQAELARRVGLTSQAVNQIESGRKAPSLTTLRKLANALGLEVHVRLHLGRPARTGP